MTNDAPGPTPLVHPSTPNDTIERAKNIRLLVLDVDGVLSDGKLFFSNSGEEMKAFNSLDGQGIKMLQLAEPATLSSSVLAV
jgi:hypothetical protein